MKTGLLTLILLISISCNRKNFEDKRPQSQIGFISFVKALRDSVNAAEPNKVLRNSLLEKNIPAVKSYIKDTLNLSFEAWQVRLIEKKENYPNSGSIQIKLGIAYDPLDESPNSTMQSIVLKANIAASNNVVLDAVKSIKIDDYVKINGQFIEKEGFIDIDSYSQYKISKNVLDNPEFNSSISFLEKL